MDVDISVGSMTLLDLHRNFKLFKDLITWKDTQYNFSNKLERLE